MAYEPDYRVDHVVVVVDNLERAISDYEVLGFTVTGGGEHPAYGSHNAIIPFEDGSYLELIAFKARRELGESPAERRIETWQSNEGLVDFALLPQKIELDIETARAAGLAMSEVVEGSRQRPDGQTVRWHFSFPDGKDLPFLCGDVTPRELRVPSGEARQHVNGATGVLRLTLATSDLDRVSTRYRALLNQRGTPGAISSLPETQIIEFSLGSSVLALAAPLGSASPLTEYLTTHGDGPYGLQVRTRLSEVEGPIDTARTHGARIELVYA